MICLIKIDKNDKILFDKHLNYSLLNPIKIHDKDDSYKKLHTSIIYNKINNGKQINNKYNSIIFNSLKNTYPTYINTKKIKSLINFPIYNINISDICDKQERVTAGTIGKFVISIVEFVRETQPDYIIANDRGARIIGLAVKMLYRNMYGRLPTVDGTLRFRRISKSNPENETEKHLQPLVEEMLRHRKEPRVLVLDDWALSGKTKNWLIEYLIN